jgi:uncharacterized protein involved in exopolysaccharide biosynthesis
MLTTVSSPYVFYQFYTVFKRWKASALFFIVCLLLAGLYVWYMPWYYQSDAQIIIKAGDKDIAEANSNLVPEQAQQTSSETIRRIVNTYVGVFHSVDVTRETLNRLGVAAVYPEIVASPPRFFGTPLDAAIERLDKADLTITIPPNSNVLQVSLVNINPAMAQTALKTLIAVFVEKDNEVMRDPRAQFLMKQVAAARERVVSIQSALVAYKKQNGISSFDDERSLLLRQRDLLEQNLGTENSQSLHLSLTTAQAALATAEQRYLQISQSYAPDSPVRERALSALNLARQQYNTLIGLLGDQGETLLVSVWTSRLKAINARLDQLNEAESTLLDLHRRLDIATQIYMAFAQRMANADFTLALNEHGSPSVAISQEPTLPYAPARPRIRLVLGLGLVIGLMGGLGLCFLLEAVDETIGLPDEVEPLLGLPVLATLDHSRMIKSIARRRSPTTANSWLSAAATRMMRIAPQSPSGHGS